MQEILEISNKQGLAEAGGGHGQKGVDFQRHWAILRMFDLEKSGVKDFLLLFESIQDIAEFDSSTAPSSVKIYQIKKRERSEWTWTQLTGLPNFKNSGEPKQASSLKKAASNKKKLNKEKIGDSPIGKLYLSVIAFEKLGCEGRFVSNMGCDVPLANGGNLATAMPSDLTN